MISAFNTILKVLTEFHSESELQNRIEGIEIAEGDWLFFAADGSPLKAKFSVPARMDVGEDSYCKGVYSLKPASPEEFEDMLSVIYKIDNIPNISSLNEVKNLMLAR